MPLEYGDQRVAKVLHKLDLQETDHGLCYALYKLDLELSTTGQESRTNWI